MPALDFPSTGLVHGQVDASGNYFWDSSISAWRSNGTTSAMGPRVTALETFATNSVGLKNVVPTSVTPVSGTASINGLGTTTFTNCTKIQINGVFTGYVNYKIVLRISSSTAFELHSRYTTGGTENSTSNYNVHLAETSTGSWTSVNQASQNRARWAFIGNSADTIIENIVTNPGIARTTSSCHQVASYNGAAWLQIYDNVFYATTVFDGINFYSAAGQAFSGDVTIYGINQ